MGNPNVEDIKIPGVDNVPAELIKQLIICQNIWETKTWPEEWTKSLIITIPKKGNVRCCKNYRTISLISHPSKIMLKIILNGLKGKAETLLSEEQAGFRPTRSTTEQIFNIRLLIEKHHQNLHHNFINFKKAFDLEWHKGLWRVVRRYNIDKGLVILIESLHGPSSSAVLHEGEIEQSFRASVRLRQGCLLSQVLFNIYLENIMQEALHNVNGTVLINRREISNLRFAYDIDKALLDLLNNHQPVHCDRMLQSLELPRISYVFRCIRARMPSLTSDKDVFTSSKLYRIQAP